MSDDTAIKYKHFRQFMANELNVTRDDVREWAEKAVQAEVRRLIGQMDITPGGMARRMREELRSIGNAVAESAGIMLAKRIILMEEPDDGAARAPASLKATS